MTEQTLPIEYLKTISVQELLDFRHSSCDVFLVLSGSVSLTTETGTTQYCENDLVILNAGSSCTLEAQEKNALLCLGISSWFVEQCLGSYGMIFCDSVQEPRSSCLALKQLMRGISAAYLEDSKKNFLSIYSQLYQFMSLLKKYHCFAMPVDKDIPKKYHSRVEKLINYVNLNYDKPLSLLDLAEALHLSPQYLSKFFKQYLHKNFKEFLLEKRLFHASREVRYTDMPITDIAIHCGFPDIATFNRAFRDAFSMTPGQYRKSVRNQHLTADYNDFEMDRREVLPTTPPLSYSQTASVCVSDEGIPLPPVLGLINVGSVTNLLLESFQQQLLEARNELGFVEVRLLGVVSSAFIPRVLPTYEPYFQNLDKALGFLLKNGLVPFFELSKIPWDSSQPSALQPESSFVVKNNRYFELLEAFLAHCADAYPASWTDRWEFELWKSDKETPEDYVAAFGRIQELIRRYLPKVRFGGFGFPSGGSEEEFSKMLSLFQSAKLTPDFISASLSLQEAGDISWVSTDRDVFYSRAKALCEILKNQGADLPLYITEWNSVFLPNLPIQASCFQAAFVCRNSLILSQFASRSAYWLFSPSPLLSGLVQKSMAFWEQGLVTRDGLKTPAYRAFQFLHMLGNTLIRKGDNFCVVKSGASHFQVLAFHYVHFSSSPGKLRDLSFQNTYQLFENTLILDFSMSLSDLAPGTYRIHRILLDRANGSALDLWIGGFASSSIDQREYLSNIALPNREQLDYLKNACVPELRTIYLDVKDTLTVRTSLQPHTVCLWDIQHLI